MWLKLLEDMQLVELDTSKVVFFWSRFLDRTSKALFRCWR